MTNKKTELEPVAYAFYADEQYHSLEFADKSVLAKLRRGVKHFEETGSTDAKVVPLYTRPTHCDSEADVRLNDLLNAIEADLKKLLQDKRMVANMQKESGHANTVAKLQHNGMYHALGVIQNHRKKAGI